MPQLLPIQLGKVLYKLTAGLSGKDLDKAVAAFLDLVREQQQASKMLYIIKEYEAYAKRMEGKEDVEITSATDISDDTVQAIFGAMNLDNDVTLTKKVDETLIGGVVVKKGNTIFDASTKTQLDQMKLTIQ